MLLAEDVTRCGQAEWEQQDGRIDVDLSDVGAVKQGSNEFCGEG